MKPVGAWSLVFLQFLFIALLVVLPAGTLWPRSVTVAAFAAVLVVVALGLAGLAGAKLGPTLTPSPIPREQGHLETGGVYGIVRHPIYTALLVGAAGLALWGGSVAHLIVFGLLVGLLSMKARAEERMLFAKYEDYRDYAAKVGRFVPGLGRVVS